MRNCILDSMNLLQRARLGRRKKHLMTHIAQIGQGICLNNDLLLHLRFRKKEDEKKKTEKLKFLQEHPNADTCVTNIALALYNENSKKMACDKLPLEKCFKYAFEIYERNFV